MLLKKYRNTTFWVYKLNIYTIEKIIVMGKKDKVSVSISIDRKLDDYMEEMFDNKSAYIEWLIEQDLLKSGIDLEKIII